MTDPIPDPNDPRAIPTPEVPSPTIPSMPGLKAPNIGGLCSGYFAELSKKINEAPDRAAAQKAAMDGHDVIEESLTSLNNSMTELGSQIEDLSVRIADETANMITLIAGQIQTATGYVVSELVSAIAWIKGQALTMVPDYVKEGISIISRIKRYVSLIMDLVKKVEVMVEEIACLAAWLAMLPVVLAAKIAAMEAEVIDEAKHKIMDDQEKVHQKEAA